MDFREEDFPLYTHLVNLDQAATVHARKDFAAACAGGDIEKYNFAFGIQTVAANVPLGQIPGVTEEMNTKTLQSCLVIFKKIAAGSYSQTATAKQMTEYLERRLNP